MPRTKLTRKFCEPKPNMLRETLRTYKRASGLTDSDIAQKMGWTRETASRTLNQPADNWKLGELKRYCDIIKCPLDAAMSSYTKNT